MIRIFRAKTNNLTWEYLTRRDTLSKYTEIGDLIILVDNTTWIVTGGAKYETINTNVHVEIYLEEGRVEELDYGR